MSMIHSAQVFTPGPSQNGRENLRILQTPIKTPFSRESRRQSSPLKRGAYIPEEDDEDEEEEDIVLVESKHPSVYQEEQDLVILEHVFVKEPEPAPEPAQFPLPQPAQQQTMQTPPRKRPQSRASLHRTVLLRSAQRVRIQKEIEQEEEEMDADEVEQSMMHIEEDVEEEEEEEEPDYHQEDQDHEQEPQSRGVFSGIRKSLDAVKGWAFRASSVPDDAHEDVDVKDGYDDQVSDAEVGSCRKCPFVDLKYFIIACRRRGTG